MRDTVVQNVIQVHYVAHLIDRNSQSLWIEALILLNPVAGGWLVGLCINLSLLEICWWIYTGTPSLLRDLFKLFLSQCERLGPFGVHMRSVVGKLSVSKSWKWFTSRKIRMPSTCTGQLNSHSKEREDLFEGTPIKLNIQYLLEFLIFQNLLAKYLLNISGDQLMSSCKSMSCLIPSQVKYPLIVNRSLKPLTLIINVRHLRSAISQINSLIWPKRWFEALKLAKFG